MNPPDAIIEWPSPPAHPPLAGNDIHVWAASLRAPPEVLQRFSASLAPDEKERANRFKFEKHRNRFIAGRAILRAILARYLATDATRLRFAYLENGKPALADEFGSAGIHFNLAHTEDLALAAITRIGLVGVDVESVRPAREVDQLVARFFSPRENELFRKVSAAEKPAAFFNLWTRKEALLKATGEGITRSLSLVEVSFLPGEPARLLAISGNEQRAAEWRLQELSPAVGFTAAVAVDQGTSNAERTSNAQHPATNIQLTKGGASKEIVVKCWKWTNES